MKYLIILLITTLMCNCSKNENPKSFFCTYVGSSHIIGDYQIDLKDSTALLYDNNRLVGEFIVKDDLSKLILKDNQ